MTATDLLQYVTWVIFFAIFVLTCIQYVRRPRRTNLNIALLFGVIAFIIADSLLARLDFYAPNQTINNINGMLILLLPYVLLRLVDDFVGVNRIFMRLMEGCLLLAISVIFILPAPAPAWVTIGQVFFFVGLQLYVAFAFARAAQRATGVNLRRLRIVALGSLFLALSIFTISLQPFSTIWLVISQTCSLASGVCYFLGFSPPSLIRRAWQEPELRIFLGRVARIPRLTTTSAVIRDIEQGAAASLGSPNAVIGVWDAEANLMRFNMHGEVIETTPAPEFPSGRAFLQQRPVFIIDAFQDTNTYANLSRKYNARVVLCAPITSGDKKIGVLTVYGSHSPLFAEDDLELVQLLANQAAVILESRALIDEASRVLAREEATRLKDDFLSAAAHDLKTPLTTIVGRAQLLERRALREPEKPADLRSIQTIVMEAQRLHTLVRELLDASRAEHGQLLGILERVDLVHIASEACEHLHLHRHQIVIDAATPVVGSFDTIRLRQLVDNLYENAVKYSPEGGKICVKIWQEDQAARLSVADQGIGIPANDLPHIFDRFYRAKNVDDRSFAGMGLGLFICRAIVEQHGGRIWASSQRPGGTTFDVMLPLGEPPKE